MINNGGKSGGNPYHDENGHFTSKGNQGSGNASQKVNQNTGNQPVDFAASIWNDFLKSQEQPKKTTGEKVLNQMGLTNEEVMEKHEEMSDEKALNDLSDKMDKLEEDIEYDDIDADYERSYGPVDSPEKYEAYQKWLENGHSFDNIGGEEEQVQADANYLKEHELESTKDLAPWDKPDEPDPEHDAKVDNAMEKDNKVLNQMGLSENDVKPKNVKKDNKIKFLEVGKEPKRGGISTFSEQNPGNSWIDLEQEAKLGKSYSIEDNKVYRTDKNGEKKFVGYLHNQGDGVHTEYSTEVDTDGTVYITFPRYDEWYERDGINSKDYFFSVPMEEIVDGLIGDYMTDEDWEKYNSENPLTEETAYELLDKYYEKAEEEYRKNRGKNRRTWLDDKEDDAKEEEYLREQDKNWYPWGEKS